MNELYEKLCKEVNWGKNSKINDVRLRLMQTWSKEDLAKAQKHADRLLSWLDEHSISDEIARVNGYYGDSVHDCLCELVAHGEEYVRQVIANPQIAVKRFNDNDYTENFMYIFPHEDDYESLTLQYHLDRAAIGLGYLDTAKFEFEAMYLQSYMEKTGGFDFVLGYEVMSEITNGVANKKRNYDDIYRKTLNIGHHAYFANVWKEFVTVAHLLPDVEILN